MHTFFTHCPFFLPSHYFLLFHFPSTVSFSLSSCSSTLYSPRLASLWIFVPYTLCLFIPPPSILLRIKVHFAAGEPVGRVRLAEPGPDLVVLPAECQRALGQRAVRTTPPGPLWAPVWPRDRWAEDATWTSASSILYHDCYHGNLMNCYCNWCEQGLSFLLHFHGEYS